MKKTFLVLAVGLTANVLFNACSKTEISQELPEKGKLKHNVTQFVPPTEKIELGEKLNDPYNMKNMLTAYSELKKTKADCPEFEIKPTHNYLRFLPKTDEEWDILKSDTNLVLYDFPLDYEIKNEGTYYHDPSLPDPTFTYQYAVIPIGNKIPGLAYELLYEVYIPSKDSKYTEAKYTNWLDELEFESVKLTGNLPDDYVPGTTKGWLFPDKWTPKGYIFVWDDLLNRSIPLVQATVQARWFVHVEKDLTDNYGYFHTGRFRYRVNYAIKWERGRYDIRNGNFWQAWYNGPKLKGDWNLNITGGKSLMYATIHRAAFKQFYGNNKGIRRPNLLGGRKTKICYIDKEGTGVFWGDWSMTGILPDIRIWGKDEGTGIRKKTQIVFGTTIHELAHQAHSQLVGNIQFWQTSKTIYESWATAVEWNLTNHEYKFWGNIFNTDIARYYNHEEGRQWWKRSISDWEYSPIFIDLIDPWNQRLGWSYGLNTYSGRSYYPNDKITGYSLKTIENHILDNAYGLSSLKNAVKNYKISGVTNADIDDLFELY